MATKITIENKKVRFESSGFVLGFDWFNQQGGYSAKEIKADTREEILDKAIDMLNDGSLDQGFGFQSLKGALIDIKKIETLTIAGKDYVNENTETLFLGELTPEEMEFLENCAFLSD